MASYPKYDDDETDASSNISKSPEKVADKAKEGLLKGALIDFDYASFIGDTNLFFTEAERNARTRMVSSFSCYVMLLLMHC